MMYLILQILFCLILAATLGFVIGWLMRGISAKHRERYLSEQYEKKLKQLNKSLSTVKPTQISTTPAVKAVSQSESNQLKTDDPISQAHIEDYYIEVIEGIGQSRGKIIREEGVSMVQEFLERYRNADESRKELADKLEVDEETVRRWVSMADLMRIKGIGSQYSELLEACGVHSVPMLAQQDAEQLAEKMKLVNRAEHSTILRLPDASQIKVWIEIAGSLPPVIAE